MVDFIYTKAFMNEELLQKIDFLNHPGCKIYKLFLDLQYIISSLNKIRNILLLNLEKCIIKICIPTTGTLCLSV